MNYEEARVYLDNVSKYGSVLGLDSVRELLRRLGNPQDDLKFIHIAGTNGKGSVLAYLSTVLKEAGYKVGRYISPTLFAYRERIQVNEEYIEREALARLTTRIAAEVSGMKESGMQPTAFEIETAMAFLYFQEKKCDLVVLEVGFGGLEDATNVVTTTVMEVITKIGYDHMAILGNTLEEIAANKAGIIKPETLVVSMKQRPEAMRVIEEVCQEKHAALHVADPEKVSEVIYGVDSQSFSYGGEANLTIHLAGAYQIDNAVLAVEAVHGLRSLGYEISRDALERGLQKAVWRGRFTLLNKHPLVIVDGAHNEDGALVLKRSLELYFADRKIHYIMGMFRDKEYEKVLAITAPLAESILTVQTPGNPRALEKEELAKAAKKYHKDVKPAKDIASAVEESLKKAGENDVILAFGSLSFLSEIEKALEHYQRKAWEND